MQIPEKHNAVSWSMIVGGRSRAVALHDQPISVVFDLMQPVGAGRDFVGAGRDAGLENVRAWDEDSQGATKIGRV
jgi:hypothetical protein